MLLFKSDLVAVRVVTYCRNTEQILSSSSELYRAELVTVMFYVTFIL